MNRKITPFTRKVTGLVIMAFFAATSLNAQNYFGSQTITAPGATLTIDVKVYTAGDSVVLTMTGPSNVWHSIGFGGSIMNGTYCLLTDGTGAISERALGNQNAGTSLASSLTSSSRTVSGTTSTTKVTRTIMGMNSSYFSFPTSAGAINLIWAYGSGASFAYHANRGATTISLSLDCTNALDVSVNQAGSQLTANLAGATYQWLDCNNGNAAISGATSQSYTPTANGSYAVEISNGGCTDTSACTTVSGIGLDENDFSDQVKAYPSPTAGPINVDLGSVYQGVTATLVDLSGRQLDSKTFSATSLIEFDVEGPAGAYFIKIETEGGQTAFVKVLKNK